MPTPTSILRSLALTALLALTACATQPLTILGFADREIADWCEAAGIASVKTTTLAPNKSGALTVKIWAGEKA